MMANLRYWLLTFTLVFGGSAFGWTGDCRPSVTIPEFSIEQGSYYTPGHALTGWINGPKCQIGSWGTWGDMGLQLNELRSSGINMTDSDGKVYTIYTNLPVTGIGFIVKVRMVSDKADVTEAVSMYNKVSRVGSAYSWADAYISIKFVSYGGPINSFGTFPSYNLNLGYLWLGKGGMASDLMKTWFNMSGFNIKQVIPTCRSSHSSYALSMGVVPVRRLPSQGSSVRGNPIQIQLDCRDAAIKNMIASVQFTDMTMPSNISERLNLTTNSTAEGVAIGLVAETLRANGSANSGPLNVKFAPISTIYGSLNSHPLPIKLEPGGTDVLIRLTPYYLRTGSTIKAGSANGMVMMTIKYQ